MAADAPAKTVASSTLKGNQRRYEYELLCRLREVVGRKVTAGGPGLCGLQAVLRRRSWPEYVIRLRGDIYVTNARGERPAAAAWVGAGGRAQRLVGARVTDTYELPVGVVVCVQDPKMDAVVPGGQRSDSPDAGPDSVLRQALGD